MNDISEVQVGDKVYSNNGLEVIEEIDSDYFYTDKYAYTRSDGQCVALPQTCARPASKDDIARHEKKQLVDSHNSTAFSEMSIKHLEAIDIVIKNPDIIASIHAKLFAKIAELETQLATSNERYEVANSCIDDCVKATAERCAKWADDLSENGVLTRSQLRDKLMDFAAAIREGGDA